MKEQQTDDLKLVDAFKQGDESAFDCLMEKHAPKLYMLAASLLNSSEDAEEVVQDAFVRIFRALSGFRGDSSFSTWARRIVMNLARNKYHWNRRRGEHIKQRMYYRSADGEDERVMDFPDNSTLGPEAQLQHRELEAKIHAAFGQLPFKLRQVMVLRHVEQQSYEDIARILKCKCGTVKSRLSRAREMIRQKIKQGN